MPTNIGPKIGIDGEAEYRKQLQGIITETKTLGTEMKASSHHLTETSAVYSRTGQSGSC